MHKGKVLIDVDIVVLTCILGPDQLDQNAYELILFYVILGA